MLLILLVAFLPACLGFSQCGTLSPGEMARRLYEDADKDSNSELSVEEMISLFSDYDKNADGSISRQEYLEHVAETEPEMVQWYDMLYEVFDSDGDHSLDLHDFVNFHQAMDPDQNGAVTKYDFIGYWSVLMSVTATETYPPCTQDFARA